MAGAVSSKTLKDLLNMGSSMDEDLSNTREPFATAVKEAVDKKGLDKEIFAFIRKMNKKTAEVLNGKLSTLKDYLELSGLNKRAASAPSFDEAEEDENVVEHPAARGRRRNGEAQAAE